MTGVYGELRFGFTVVGAMQTKLLLFMEDVSHDIRSVYQRARGAILRKPTARESPVAQRLLTVRALGSATRFLLGDSLSIATLQRQPIVQHTHGMSCWQALRPWAPAHRPLLWFSINLACLAASLDLLADMIVSDETGHFAWSLALYGVWSALTTIIYVVEVSLMVIDRSCAKERKIPLVLVVEVAVATYFLVDGVQSFLHWHQSSSRADIEQSVADVIVNCVVYLWASFTCWLTHRYSLDDVETGYRLEQEPPPAVFCLHPDEKSRGEEKSRLDLPLGA